MGRRGLGLSDGEDPDAIVVSHVAAATGADLRFAASAGGFA